MTNTAKPMRAISELLEFLTHKMSMQTIYQPAIILYLLTQGGVASRTSLARLLSGYDERNLEFWNRVLMKSPKQVLVDTHQILSYDKSSQNFLLNFNLVDSAEVEQAKAVCISKMETWIQKETINEKLPEDEILWLNRVLELAQQGDQYHLPELNPHLEEFAIGVVLEKLNERYPGHKVTQQPYNQVGFDILVGTSEQPIAYIKVKATEALQPIFSLSEGERQFSIAKTECYVLALVYAINLSEASYQFAWHEGAIQSRHFGLVPLQWKAKLISTSSG